MKNFKKSYNRLNKEQKKAVDTIEGPSMIVAGPGSGKTELLSVRAANILKKKDVPTSSLLCLTFTDAAALNMRERLVEMIGEDGYKVPTFTFHSFCKEIIDNNPSLFYEGADFDLADEITKTEIIEDILQKLDYDDPLSSKHPERGYVYLRTIKSKIADLKEGGLTPEEFKKVLDSHEEFVKEVNPLITEVFDKRVSKSIFSEIEELISTLKGMDYKLPVDYFKPLNKVLVASLEEAFNKEGTKGVTAWKSDWTKRVSGKRVLRDFYYIEKQQSLANIYQQYEKKMYEKGLYDFSDMILDVIKVLGTNESLRRDFEEKYLYLMVDEFQDTSGVQMRLLKNLTKDEPHGQPNICVVGDDDQAIYRFQGAEISNILNFKDLYEDVEVITLKKSYRSGQKILDTAKKIISKGEERLESRLEGVDKDLKAAREEMGNIVGKEFKTKEEEYTYVAKEVKKLIDEKGTDPQEIAVIGRKHKILKQAAPFFANEDIPIYAERKVNVLENEIIKEIITIIRFSVYLLEGDKDKAEELLPEVLSYPFWNLTRGKLLKLSRRAYRNNSWMDEMKKDSELSEIFDFLTNLSEKSKYKPVEEIIDIVVGNKESKFSIRDYYFSEKELKKSTAEYFKVLSALKTFVNELKSYKEGEFLKARDLLDFVDRHEGNNIPINDQNPLITDSDSVSLITAHSAKGREFENVFVLSCMHEVWGKGRRASKLPFPSNMPLERAGENKDDQLRLFYVTLTRAKDNLFITTHRKKENGRSYSPLEFIEGISTKEDKLEVGPRELEASRKKYYSPPFREDEREFLKPLAQKYKLSATGFNKYLNVASEGPEDFLRDTLLRFPSKKPLAASFGTAIHETIGWLYNDLKESDKLVEINKVLEVFEEFLKKERLANQDFDKYLERGGDALKAFYKSKKDEFSSDHIIEKNFRNQGVVISGNELTGKIDKIAINGNKAKVYDFKTGKPIEKWNPSGGWNKIKAWKYKNQLVFYKLLIENSREFENVEVEKGYLEFIEPKNDENIITLPLEITDKDVKRVKKLIKIVGEKIRNLEFYSSEEFNKKSIKEIKRFEEKLLNN